jgi:hypothetical protein
MIVDATRVCRCNSHFKSALPHVLDDAAFTHRDLIDFRRVDDIDTLSVPDCSGERDIAI